MTGLDQNTLLFTFCTINLIVGIILLWLSTRAVNIKGTKEWGVGSLFIALSVFLYFLYPISEFIAFVVAGGFFIGGCSFYLLGIWKFKGSRIRIWLLLLFPALQLIQGTIFFSIFPLSHIRLANYSFIEVGAMILIAIEFFKPTKAYLKTIFRIGGIILIVRSVTVLFRSINALMNIVGDPTIGTSVNLIILVVSNLFQIVIFAVFIMMTLQTLVEETQKQTKIKNRIFNIIAHDLRGPIGNITEMLKMINSPDIDSEEDRNGLLKIVESQSISSYSLLNNLLDWSRSQKELFEVNGKLIDVYSVVDESLKLYSQNAKQKQIEIVSCISAGANCFADEMMFNTVVRNLISNAIKFTKENGTIKISSNNEKGKLVIRVNDSGVGIDYKRLILLNKSQTVQSTKGTSNENGTGIGLIMCREFINQNKGSFLIESKVNEGTEVIIKLPLER